MGLNPYMTYEFSDANPDHTIWDAYVASASPTPAVLRFSGCYFPYGKSYMLNYGNSYIFPHGKNYIFPYDKSYVFYASYIIFGFMWELN